LTGTAVKVTGVPPHIFVALALIDILAVSELVTVMVTLFELTDDGLAQAASDVIVQLTILLLARPVDV
jgi:hypothetical protein